MNIVNYPLRGDIYWIKLDPTIGSEIKKTRPCVIISNNANNEFSSRVIVAPITSKIKTIRSFEVLIENEKIRGKVLLDQIRTVDKQRLAKQICECDKETIEAIDYSLKISLALD